jgi:hypothetical protein
VARLARHAKGRPCADNRARDFPTFAVTGTNASFPDGYAFIFKDNNSFTMSNGSIGPASESANPSGSNTLPLWGHSGDASPDGDISTESIRPITHLRSPKKSVA